MFIGKILAGGGGKHPAFLIFLMQEKQTVQSEMGRANEHMDEKNRDENTVILRVRLTHGVLFSHGARYEF